jgi:hypothetical protein
MNKLKDFKKLYPKLYAKIIYDILDFFNYNYNIIFESNFYSDYIIHDNCDTLALKIININIWDHIELMIDDCRIEIEKSEKSIKFNIFIMDSYYLETCFRKVISKYIAFIDFKLVNDVR